MPSPLAKPCQKYLAMLPEGPGFEVYPPLAGADFSIPKSKGIRPRHISCVIWRRLHSRSSAPRVQFFGISLDRIPSSGSSSSDADPCCPTPGGNGLVRTRLFLICRAPQRSLLPRPGWAFLACAVHLACDIPKKSLENRDFFHFRLDKQYRVLYTIE